LSFLAAFQFLTSIPLPGRRYFPVVGLIIGLILAGLNWLLSLILPSAVVNALLIVVLVIITGALHLDGFVDTCDGIAGHKAVEDRWRVMHDSRAGAFGIVGVVLLLLVKYVSLFILMPAPQAWEQPSSRLPGGPSLPPPQLSPLQWQQLCSHFFQ